MPDRTDLIENKVLFQIFCSFCSICDISAESVVTHCGDRPATQPGKWFVETALTDNDQIVQTMAIVQSEQWQKLHHSICLTLSDPHWSSYINQSMQCGHWTSNKGFSLSILWLFVLQSLWIPSYFKQFKIKLNLWCSKSWHQNRETTTINHDNL